MWSWQDLAVHPINPSTRKGKKQTPIRKYKIYQLLCTVNDSTQGRSLVVKPKLYIGGRREAFPSQDGCKSKVHFVHCWIENFEQYTKSSIHMFWSKLHLNYSVQCIKLAFHSPYCFCHTIKQKSMISLMRSNMSSYFKNEIFLSLSWCYCGWRMSWVMSAHVMQSAMLFSCFCEAGLSNTSN